MVLGTFTLYNWIPGSSYISRPALSNRNTRPGPIRCSAVASTHSFDGPGPEDGLGSDGLHSSGSQPESVGTSSSSWNFPVRNWPLLLRTFAAHAVHITARVLAHPLQPALDRFQERAAASSAVHAACAALQVEDLSSLQDVANAVVLAECVYKVVGGAEGAAVRIMSGLKASFPPGIVTVSAVQFARGHVRHRFAVGESDDAMYVAFMGTKMARDFLANAAVWQDEVQLDASVLTSDEAEGLGAPTGEQQQGGQFPAAHRGFLTRSRGIPIDALFHEAQRRGKRLVLCGHSLGGAVATLCTIQLLQRLSPEQYPAVSCIGFATPALGNEALAGLVAERGWDKRIKNYLVPEDPIPGLLSGQAPAAQQSRNIGNTGVNSSTTGVIFNTTGSSLDTSRLQKNEEGPSTKMSSLLDGLQMIDGNIAPVSDGLISKTKSASDLEHATSKSMVTSSSHLNEEHGDEMNRSRSAPAALDSSQHLDIRGGGSGETMASHNDLTSASSEPAVERGMRRSLSKGALRVVSAVAGPPARMTGNLINRGIRLPFELAAMPLNAARPKYQPIGQQLYVYQDAVKIDKPSNSTLPPPRKISSTIQSTPSMAVPLATPGEDAVSQQGGSWWWTIGFPRSFSSGGSFFLPSSEGDDDNVDVAAAAAAAGGLVPDRLPARTLFPMHRMLTYRTRLLNICEEALMGHHWPHSILPASLPHLPNFPHPDDVTPSELLAPGMFPLKAEATAVVSAHSREQVPMLALPAAATTEVAPRRRGPWPLRWLGRRPKQADNTPVDVVVRIEGRGLCNVTAAWVSGANRDAAGKAAPVGLQIISLPTPPAPSQSVRRASSPLWGPLSALASWLAMAVGAVGILRQLQPAGQADYLLAKVKLPAGAVTAAQRAAVDPLVVAVGEVPKLMVHLQSDFAVHSLPLTVVAPPPTHRGKEEGRKWWPGKSKEQQGVKGHAVPAMGVKDANRALRGAKIRAVKATTY